MKNEDDGGLRVSQSNKDSLDCVAQRSIANDDFFVIWRKQRPLYMYCFAFSYLASKSRTHPFAPFCFPTCTHTRTPSKFHHQGRKNMDTSSHRNDTGSEMERKEDDVCSLSGNAKEGRTVGRRVRKVLCFSTSLTCKREGVPPPYGPTS